jgi:hypothetical protein
VALAGELGQLLDHHGPGRHVDAQRQGLGREHDLGQARREGDLHRFLERGDEAGVVGGQPRFEPREPPAVAEHPEVLV